MLCRSPINSGWLHFLSSVITAIFFFYWLLPWFQWVNRDNDGDWVCPCNFFRFIFFLMCSLCVGRRYVHMSAGACQSQKPELPGFGVIGIVSCPAWVLRIKLRSFAKTVCALDCWASLQFLQPPIESFIINLCKNKQKTRTPNVAQLVECLPSVHEALDSNQGILRLSTTPELRQ